MAQINEQMTGKTIIREYQFTSRQLAGVLGIKGTVKDCMTNENGDITLVAEEELKKPFTVED
jgi:hypothetical protein